MKKKSSKVPTRKSGKRNRNNPPRMGGDNKIPSLNKVRGRIMEYFRSRPNVPVNYKQIAAGIGAEGKLAYKVVEEVMMVLADEKFVQESSRGKYVYTALGKTVVGTFVRRSNGHNGLIPDDRDIQIRVAEKRSGHALDGDRVRIQLCARRRGMEPEGEVIEILEQKDHTFIGVVSINNGVSFLLTESSKLSNDIFIPERFLNGAKDGDKVVVHVVEWPERAKNPLGEVLDVLGKSGDNTTEMHAILAEYGLPYSYPKEVEEAADRIDVQSAYDKKYKREDVRDRITFTIDPKTAKDFDDALSLRKNNDGTYEVGVHIADVTSYVHEGDIIDHEAKERATSVYLVDRTVPMLPERLCNDLCSLRPNEDRPAFSVIYRMNDQAEVLDYRITRTIIHSDARLTYEQAQTVIEGGEGACKEEILVLDKLAKIMRQERMKNGAIDFERSELKFEIDENGKPIGVKAVVSKDANKLVEEFMLIANRTVAAYIGREMAKSGHKAPTFVYRVHDLPDPDKLQNLSEFVMKFGYKLQTTGKPEAIARSINELLDAVQDKPEKNLVETLTLRTMAKAIYQTDNIGHYGLAFKYYTHFTSPIRRHPDMMAHRMLAHYMSGGKNLDKQKFEKMCVHDSKMEQTAAQAERSSIKYKQVEYMMQFMGESFDGVISGVTDWGFYVELKENGCEGLVPMRVLDDDYYELDTRNYCIVGTQKHKRYRLGDVVRVKVASANLERKQLDFEPDDSGL